ncbi:MAG: protein kinase [Polyangiaceae bacterium]
MSSPGITPPSVEDRGGSSRAVEDEATDPAVIRFAIECEAGRTYASRFRIVDELAHGGMGIVYEADDLERGERVAFKVLRKSFQLHPRAVDQFLVEGKFLCRSKSDAIPKGHAYGVDDACGPYLAMEILRGHTLAELGREPWTEQQVACVGVAIARALAPLHAEGMVHRDIKPQNLFVLTRADDASSIRLLDWGIAKSAAGDTTTSDVRLTGTLRYMSPEQIRGKRATPASDVYSLAIVLYELLAKRFCYGEDADAYVSDHVYAMWHQHAELVPLPDVCPVKPAGWEILGAALARDPSERVSDAGRFAEGLARWLDAASIPGARATRPATIQPSTIDLPGVYGVRDGGPPDRQPPPIAPLPEGVHGRLEVLDGPTRERFFDLPSRTISIGRGADADIAIEEASISQRHASIAISAQLKRFLIRDEGSRNGTRINGEALAPSVWRALQHADRVLLGRVELMFHSVARIEAEAALTPVKRGGTVAMARTPAAPAARVTLDLTPARAEARREPAHPRKEDAVTADALPLIRVVRREPSPAGPPPSKRSVVYDGRPRDTVPAWLIVIGVIAVGFGAFLLFRALGLG